MRWLSLTTVVKYDLFSPQLRDASQRDGQTLAATVIDDFVKQAGLGSCTTVQQQDAGEHQAWC